MNIDDKIWVMMARSVSGEISAEEQEELTLFLENNPQLNQQYSMLAKLWDKKINTGDAPSEEEHERTLFKKIINKAEIERRNSGEKPDVKKKSIIPDIFFKRFIYICAASVALLAVFFLSKTNTESVSQSHQIVSAQNGSRSKVLLPDGSTVWLNGGSKLYYDYEFSGPRREVRLVGEAFFDVAEQKDRPFIVHAGKIDIKVHGTVFNVKCYQDDTNIETTLLHGKIEVFDNSHKDQPSVFLVPNQKLIVPVPKPSEPIKMMAKKTYELVNLDTKLAEKERVETAWVYNRIEFRGENFEDLAKKLERWYNVSIVFADDDIRALTFNGSFEKETVDQAFAALKKVGTFDYNIQGREIFIKSAH